MGSAQLQLADDVFDNYRKATGAVDDVATGRLTITLAQFEALQPLNFTFLQVGITFFLIVSNHSAGSSPKEYVLFVTECANTAT